MTIILPSVVVHQEFAQLSPAATQDLYACIIGPKRHVVSAAVSEAADLAYGAYDPDSDTILTLNTLPAGESPDAGSIEVSFEDAYGLYADYDLPNEFNPDASSDNKINADTAFTGYLSYLASGAPGSPFLRDAGLGERDVKVGDYARVTHEDGTLLSKITSLEYGLSNPSTASANGALTAGAGNQAAKVAAFAVAEIVGNTGGSRLIGHFADGDVAGSYHGDLAGGNLSDTYIITCITAGTYDVAQFSVSSTNGDNVSIVTIGSNSTDPMAVGTKGLEVEIDLTTGGDMEVGEKWSFTVTAAYDLPELRFSSEGVDAGTPWEFLEGTVDKDTVYTVKVIKGGHFGAESADPKVIITSDNNHDSSPPLTIEVDTTRYPFGSRGLGVNVDPTASPQGLVVGDTFSIAITGRKQTGAKSFFLQDPIPKLDSDGGAINGATQDLFVEFLVKADSVDIPAADFPDEGDENWTLEDDGTVSLKSGIQMVDASVLDGSGDQLPIPVVAADVLASYTAILNIGAPDIGTIGSASSIEGILGHIVPENEVAYGVYKALQNSGGQPVRYITTPGADLSAFLEALEKAESDTELYYLTPMTTDLEVSNAVIAHVEAMSDPGRKRERHAVVARDDNRTRHMVQFKPGTEDTYGGYIANNPDSVALDVTIPGATLVTSGVESGDVLRIDFTPEPGGGETYDSYTIASVEDEENFTLASGPDDPIGSVGAPVRVEIVREQDRDEWAEQVANQSTAFGNRRVSRGFGGGTILDDADRDVATFFVNAAYAGLRSGVVPHRPVTNVNLLGFKSLPDMVNVFTPTDLETLALGGTLVFMQEVVDGPIFILHQVTTDRTDENTSEISVVANGDSIAKFLRASVDPFIGKNNINDDLLVRVRTLLQQKIDFLQAETNSLEAGPQILELLGEIELVQSDVNRTKVDGRIELALPYPFNILELTLFFG